MVDQTSTRCGLVEVHFAGLQAADVTLTSLLNGRERARLERIVTEADRGRFLLGVVLLRRVVGAHLGIEPERVEIDRTCITCGEWHGKPTIPGSDLQLSVAHSATLVAVATAAGYRIGIDVEQIRERPAEQIRRWTAAEARFKADPGADLPVYDVPVPHAGYLVTLATDAPSSIVLALTQVSAPLRS